MVEFRVSWASAKVLGFDLKLVLANAPPRFEARLRCVLDLVSIVPCASWASWASAYNTLLSLLFVHA